MKIQIASDIHLELHGDRNFANTIIPSAPILALLGDIGNAIDPNGIYERFLYDCSINFEYVFVIAGNHEYYGTTIEDGNARLNDICSKFRNVHFLNNTFFIIDGILIFGSTLWSNIKKNVNIIKKNINDFRHVKDLTVKKINSMHELAIWHIKRLLDIRSEDVIILSHHTPSFNGTSDPIYKNSPLREYFSTNLEYIMEDSDKLKIWAYGHTHWNNIDIIHNTRVCSNQMGYDLECKTEYNHKFILIDEYDKFMI